MNRDWLLPVLGCMPPWLSDTDHCDTPVLRTTPEHEEIRSWLYSLLPKAKTGLHFESNTCQLPCSYYSFQSKLLDAEPVSDTMDFKKFNLFFSGVVKG